ncbi:MAG: hypothetical protein ACRBFS_14320 [Aureispira sp.]
MKKWMPFFNRKRSSSLFIPDKKGGFIEYTEPVEGNGSISAIEKHFGYANESTFVFSIRSPFISPN